MQGERKKERQTHAEHAEVKSSIQHIFDGGASCDGSAGFKRAAVSKGRH